MSHVEMLTTISLMQKHMFQQQETNQVMLKELHAIKVMEDVVTPLYSGTLNFDSAG